MRIILEYYQSACSQSSKNPHGLHFELRLSIHTRWGRIFVLNY